jgi:DNA-binding winged helix-turn-helix (wHTH) protein
MSVAAEVVAYRFDGFVLDLTRAALVTDKGETVPVRHKSFRLLCLFVENAGRLVAGRTVWNGPGVRG